MEVRACLEQSGELACGVDHLLEVVEEQEQLPLADVLREPVLRAQQLTDRLGHERWVAQPRQTDPEDAGLEVADELSPGLQREPRLPRAAGAAEGDQPVPADEVDHLCRFALAADKRRGGPRQVRVRDRLERWKARRAELKDPHRPGEILQSMLAQLEDFPLDERPGRRREEHLAAVAGRRNPGAEMDIVTDIPLLRPERSPRMKAHPDADRPRRQRLVGGRGRGHCGTRVAEHIEERVTLSVHLDTPARRERLPHEPPMLGERRRILRRAELLQQPRRPLHIRERKRHHPGRKHRRHGAMMPLLRPPERLATNPPCAAPPIFCRSSSVTCLARRRVCSRWAAAMREDSFPTSSSAAMTWWASTRGRRTETASCDPSFRRGRMSWRRSRGTRSSQRACSTMFDPLDDGVALLARLAPLLLVDEFAPT